MYADAMEAVKELLLEALNDLSEEDLPKFQWHLQFIRFQKGLPQIPFSLLEFAKMTFILDVVVETCGLRSLEVTREIFKDMQRTDLVHKLSKSSAEATVEAVKGLLLETLKDLNEEDLMDFKWFLQFKYFLKDPQIPCWQLKNADRKFIIDLIVKVCRQQSLDITTEVFRDMNRMDLVQRLSKSSSGFKEKDQVYERWPALIHNVEEMTSLVELLLETLADLSHREVKDFKVVLSRNYFSVMPWSLLKVADQQDIVFFMVQTFGQQSVPEIMECLKEMKRTDLAQRLSDCSSEPKKKYVDEHLSPMIHNEATVEAVKELLLETLEDLSEEDLEHLICFLQFTRFQNGLPQIPLSLLEYSDLTFIIDLIVEMCGQQSLEVTTELFRDINRMDLVQRLSKSSSGFKDKPSVDKRYCGLIQKVATVAAVKHLLLGALNDLSNEELDEFERFLDLTNNWKNLHYASGMLNHLSIRAIIVNLMVDQHGQPSVEVTREVFMHMNKTDLVQKLPESSSASREKHSVDEHGAALLKRDEALAVVEEIILETLKDLSHKEIKKFRLLVLFTCSEIDLPEMEKDTTDKVVHHMVDELGLQSLEVTREVLTDMNKTDLAQSLLELTKRFKGQETKRSFKPEQDSSDWTKLEPEVNSTDADEAPTYSLQSAAGHFECRVSGLRWVCKGKTSFQYQFRSWEGHMERMESRQYMPAGPLMDVTVTAGKLIEVHLPHWICIDDIPDILDMFAVVHIDDCGDVVEKVSEVTPTHVKLTEPHFSLLAALIRFIFPPKISCYTLMYYKPNTSFLKLHVYLIRQDPALEQIMDKKESSHGFKKIPKPHPDKYMQTECAFSLRADMETAEIQPKELTFRYNSLNFYEVFIENPGRQFHLTLLHSNDGDPVDGPVWICKIQKDDHPLSGHTEVPSCSEKHFVDEHLSAQGGKASFKSDRKRHFGMSKDLEVKDPKKFKELPRVREAGARMPKALTVQSDRERLLGMLEDLKQEELEKFKWFLRDRDGLVEFQPIPESKLEKTSTCNLVDLMFGAYTQHTVEVTKKVFRKINRNDLVKKLSDTSS